MLKYFHQNIKQLRSSGRVNMSWPCLPSIKYAWSLMAPTCWVSLPMSHVPTVNIHRIQTLSTVSTTATKIVDYKQGSEQALCSLFIATLFPGWVCLPHLQFWLRLNGGHISRSGFGAKLCFMTCHNFMTYSVMFLINSVKGDFDFK